MIRRWPMRMATRAGSALGSLLLLVIAGCSTGATKFVHPEADMPYYQKVAVLPFTTLAQDRLAGEKVTSVFYAEVLQLGFDEVVEPGQFATAMQKVRGGTPYTNPWSAQDIAKLGEVTGIQGLFMGTVRDYEMTHTGRDSYPLISLEVRFVDAATGRVVWTASETRRGNPAAPFLSFTATRTIGELTTEICRELLGTLPKVGG